MSSELTINYGNVVAGSNALPAEVATSYFYATWAGYIIPSVSGLYTIGVNSQDGVNFSLCGVLLIANIDAAQSANGTAAYTQSFTINLTAGVYYDFILEWQHGSGPNYELQLLWTAPNSSVAVVIPSANLSQHSYEVTSNLAGIWWNGTSTLWYPKGNGVVIGGDTGGSSRPPTGTSAAVTTGSLAANASENDTLTMAKMFTAYMITVNYPARVRLYSTAAARTADASRANSVPPVPGTQHGVIADLYLDTSDKYTWLCSPDIPGSNKDGPQSTAIYAAITNLDVTSRAITATIYFVPMES
jgi:hypothetical protein